MAWVRRPAASYFSRSAIARGGRRNAPLGRNYDPNMWRVREDILRSLLGRTGRWALSVRWQAEKGGSPRVRWTAQES